MASHKRIKAWSIYERKEITSKYKVSGRIGSGAYSDVYKGMRHSDSAIFALKEIHDYVSARREIDALQALQNCPNVVVLHEYFWSDEEENAVLVLEYLPSDLCSVIADAQKNRKDGSGIPIGEIKRWMSQILVGVDACHRNNIMHRDLKPSNLLVSSDGVLKVADFGQAIILKPDVSGSTEQKPGTSNDLGKQPHTSEKEGSANKEQLIHDQVDQKLKNPSTSDTDKVSSVPDTGSSSEEDYYYPDGKCKCRCDRDKGIIEGELTQVVGTRWYRAPELLFGSINYGLEIDLWSLGCIFAELMNLEPLFPGTSDIDQIFRIINVLGNLTKENYPGCVNLPDYGMLCFDTIEKPVGIEGCLPGLGPNEILLIKKLLCYDPARRTTAMELLQDKYLIEEPVPVPISDLRVPSDRCFSPKTSPRDWSKKKYTNPDSGFDQYGGVKYTFTENGFTLKFDSDSP